MIEYIAWIVTGLSIIGVILNARMKISGFYFWILANGSWVVIDIYKGIWAQAGLFIFYFFMCFYGIYAWKQKISQPVDSPDKCPLCHGSGKSIGTHNVEEFYKDE